MFVDGQMSRAHFRFVRAGGVLFASHGETDGTHFETIAAQYRFGLTTDGGGDQFESHRQKHQVSAHDLEDLRSPESRPLRSNEYLSRTGKSKLARIVSSADHRVVIEKIRQSYQRPDDKKQNPLRARFEIKSI